MNLERKHPCRTAVALAAGVAGMASWAAVPARPTVAAPVWNLPTLAPEFSVDRHWKQVASLESLIKATAESGPAGSPKRISYYKVGSCGSVVMIPMPRYVAEDMAPVVTAAYRDCQAVVVEWFEPRVLVASYPEGHFGDLVHEGMLITQRMAVTEEAQLAALYSLLMEAVFVSAEPCDAWRELDGEDELNAGRYRREPGFVPDLALDFVGRVPLRVELSLAQRRLVLLSDTHWASFELDSGMAGALGELVMPSH